MELTSILRTAFVLPSVLHKIDSLLLVKDLNATIFNNALSDDLLSMAITCPSAGMEFDYERLELLGTSLPLLWNSHASFPYM